VIKCEKQSSVAIAGYNITKCKQKQKAPDRAQRREIMGKKELSDARESWRQLLAIKSA
jgi:hypothetical protein